MATCPWSCRDGPGHARGRRLEARVRVRTWEFQYHLWRHVSEEMAFGLTDLVTLLLYLRDRFLPFS